MKKIILFYFCLIISVMAFSQTQVLLTVGDKTMIATLVENEATHELIDLLEENPVTIRMSDYGGFEKVGALPKSLPASDSRITTVAGDIMLYQGCNLVIFYGSNTWSYTRLGKIDGASAENLREFLGKDEVSLTVSLITASLEDNIDAVNKRKEAVYDLNGRLVHSRPLSPGFYIINRKKIFLRN